MRFRRQPDTCGNALVVLGSSIALYEPPIRVAEEFAMLDVLSVFPPPRGRYNLAQLTTRSSLKLNMDCPQVGRLMSEQRVELRLHQYWRPIFLLADDERRCGIGDL
jgi:hypothetical protein